MSTNTLAILLHQYALKIEDILGSYNENIISDGYSWSNKIYNSRGNGDNFFRAHFEVVNELEKHDVYLIHFCIFPYHNDPSPIWGMDFVYNTGKISGAFHDFSPIGESTMVNWFKESVKCAKITNKRELPPWAKAIFSDSIIATGDITDEQELKDLLDLVMNNLEYYLKNVGSTVDASDYLSKHNAYARFQKKNPHIKNMMLSFGYDEERLDDFIDTILFPEYEENEKNNR